MLNFVYQSLESTGEITENDDEILPVFAQRL